MRKWTQYSCHTEMYTSPRHSPSTHAIQWYIGSNHWNHSINFIMIQASQKSCLAGFPFKVGCNIRRNGIYINHAIIGTLLGCSYTLGTAPKSKVLSPNIPSLCAYQLRTYVQVRSTGIRFGGTIQYGRGGQGALQWQYKGRHRLIHAACMYKSSFLFHTSITHARTHTPVQL